MQGENQTRFYGSFPETYASGQDFRETGLRLYEIQRANREMLNKKGRALFNKGVNTMASKKKTQAKGKLTAKQKSKLPLKLQKAIAKKKG